MRRLPLTGAIALLAAAAPSAQAAATVSFTDTQSHMRWKQGYLTGNVRFSANVTEAATVLIFIRRASDKGPVLASRQYALAAGGPIADTFKLPAQPLPGEYRLRASLVTPAGNVPLAAASRIVVPAPPEGVVARAVVSRKQGGPNVTVTPWPVAQMWVRFPFLSPPQKGLKKRVLWFSPRARLIGVVVKSNRFVVDSYIRSLNGAIPKGNWEARLVVGGKIARRTFVRIR